jgi:hypothetical protein
MLKTSRKKKEKTDIPSYQKNAQQEARSTGAEPYFAYCSSRAPSLRTRNLSGSGYNRIWGKKIFCLLGSGILASCSSFYFPPVSLKHITVSAQPGANFDLVTLVHFVFPKTPDLYKELKKMDAVSYFAVEKQLLADYVNDLEVVAVEIAPGMVRTEHVKLKDFRSQAVLVFARYDAALPGLHREELSLRKKKVHIVLGRNKFVVSY